MTVERNNKHLESFSGYPSNSTQNQHNSQYISNSVNSNVISHKNNFQSNLSHNGVDTEANESETDFFSDMVPRFKKPKKSKELGVIEHFEDENSSWEDSAANEEMWDNDQTLKKMRQQEREKRIAEHQRIKLEKEFKRSKQPKGNLLATKIS